MDRFLIAIVFVVLSACAKRDAARANDADGKVDQSIVMDSFRLESHDVAVADPK